MVIDKVNGQNIPRYLAYDIIKFDGCDVSRSAFHPIRLGCIEVSFICILLLICYLILRS
jgi:mRNA-capping enzyme